MVPVGRAEARCSNVRRPVQGDGNGFREKWGIVDVL